MGSPSPPTLGEVTKPRRLVFISHANPQDNVITLWLATRLASAGYEVWSDLTKLIGGELFWDDIAEAIRVHSAKQRRLWVLVSGSPLNYDGTLLMPGGIR